MDKRFDDFNEVGWRAEVSSLANDARFGLDYFLKRKRDDETKKLLESGMRICALLLKGSEIYTRRNQLRANELDYLHLIKPLEECLESHRKGEALPSYLKEPVSRLRNYRHKVEAGLFVLNFALSDGDIPEKDVEAAKRFFADISCVYQTDAWKILMQIQGGGCFI